MSKSNKRNDKKMVHKNKFGRKEFKKLENVEPVKMDEGFLVQVKNFNGGWDTVKNFAEEEYSVHYSKWRYDDYFVRVFSVEQMKPIWNNFEEWELNSQRAEFFFS